MGDTRQIGRNAPTGSLEFHADGYDIRACEECLAWYAQVHQDDDGVVWVIEHHAVGCATYQYVLAHTEAESGARGANAAG